MTNLFNPQTFLEVIFDLVDFNQQKIAIGKHHSSFAYILDNSDVYSFENQRHFSGGTVFLDSPKSKSAFLNNCNSDFKIHFFNADLAKKMFPIILKEYGSNMTLKEIIGLLYLFNTPEGCLYHNSYRYGRNTLDFPSFIDDMSKLYDKEMLKKLISAFPVKVFMMGTYTTRRYDIDSAMKRTKSVLTSLQQHFPEECNQLFFSLVKNRVSQFNNQHLEPQFFEWLEETYRDNEEYLKKYQTVFPNFSKHSNKVPKEKVFLGMDNDILHLMIDHSYSRFYFNTNKTQVNMHYELGRLISHLPKVLENVQFSSCSTQKKAELKEFSHLKLKKEDIVSIIFIKQKEHDLTLSFMESMISHYFELLAQKNSFPQNEIDHFIKSEKINYELSLHTQVSKPKAFKI